MAKYKRVLLAVDFHSDNDEIVSKAQEVVSDDNAELFLIHVNEPVAGAYATDGLSWSDQIVQLESAIRKEAEQKMVELGDKLGVPAENRLIRAGKPSSEIHDACKDKQIDLVVLGTHGQHGLQLLLGSTANSVLHGVECDVLCVRVGKDS